MAEFLGVLIPSNWYDNTLNPVKFCFHAEKIY